VQELKLDRSFVASAMNSTQDESVVRATVNLVQSLGIRAAADGVDSERLLYQVRSYGVQVVQGAIVGDAMTPAGLAEWLGPRADELEPPRAPQPTG
jgi:EAL domain-containing protein (putative c-di-GMP-specific phosphodiesterase class I)